jgi:hypothetical protein
MKVLQLEQEHIPAVVSLLSSTMPWAPASQEEIRMRSKHCPDGQCVVLNPLGKLIGYGFMIRTKAGRVEGDWLTDTGQGQGLTHLDRGNVAYVCSTAWDPHVPTTIRALVNWYKVITEQWRVAQVMGFSRVPSLSSRGHLFRPGDVHDYVLDRQDPLTRTYWRLGFEPAVVQPNYSDLDHESAGFGMMMVQSV